MFLSCNNSSNRACVFNALSLLSKKAGYHTQAREIRQQLDKLKTERYSSFESKILTMLEDVRKLKSLIDELEQPLEAFDEKLFHEIVTDICINHHDEMTVTLLGGLRFTEQI